VLTDSGYVAADDEAGLASILARAALLGDAIALLPLHRSWLMRPRQRAVLQDRIVEAGVPVAIVLEHAGDPLALQGVLRGLLKVLRSGAPVMLLRADTSALGALCYGAVAAAVGTVSALRHLYPVTTRRPGRRDSPVVAAVVEQCLAYVGIDKIAAAVKADPDHDIWRCDCDECAKQPIGALAQLPTHAEQEQAAFTHSLHVLLGLRDGLCRLSSADRRLSWLAQVKNAIFRWEEISAESQPSWKTPKFLGCWQEVVEGGR
jgi:hypothetical protein